MSDTCCTALTAAGQPCHAHPRPGRPFCALHDPELPSTIAEGRSKGGAAPRRRVRRLPPILDHLHVAQLLSELLVDAVNATDPGNPRQLQAVTGLSRVLLKAVGVPNTYALHSDRSEPPPESDHLLRLYPSLPPEIAALLEADPPAVSAPEPANLPPAVLNAPSTLSLEEQLTPGDFHASLEALCSFPFLPETPPSASVSTLTAAVDPNRKLELQNQPCDEVSEQVLNRSATGLPATDTSPGLSPADRPASPELAFSSVESPAPAEAAPRRLSPPTSHPTRPASSPIHRPHAASPPGPPLPAPQSAVQGPAAAPSADATTVGSVDSFVNNFRMIGPRPGNNFLVHDVVHQTINANGTLTASVDQHSVE